MKKQNNDLLQLSTPYQKLLQLKENILNIPTNQWGCMHSLSYILYKFKEKFLIDYILTYDGPPSKCYEYKLCQRIWAMLSAQVGEGEKAKQFIDWFFNNYDSAKPFRSIGAIAKVEVISKYLSNKKKEEIITTYTALPVNVLEITATDSNFSYIKTYGDLYFLMKSNMQNDESKNFLKVIEKHIDLSILENLE